ncbi:MAG: alkaline phosphatase, partial [Butyricimonas faecihominis]
LNFASFPVRNYATTYSSYHGVTCSAAAGTALATGEKTKNGTIGMDKEQKEPLYSVAVRAKEAGRKVGIITSVGMNHATPAAFYGHQPRRTMYFELGKDAIKAGFDLYGGGGIIQGGLQTTLPYAIDREEDDFTLSQMTEGAIDFLSRGKQGFFLMVEGGLIDYACHVNDAATAFREVEDFADAVQKAYEFYLKHPDETLIVVTADHETGGIVLGTGSYQLNLRVLENQRVSLEKLTREIRELRDMKSNQVAWEDVQELLAKNLGFWNTVNLSTEDEQALKNCYRETFSGKTVEMVKNLYSENEPIAQLSINILNRLAKISWASGGHSAGVVPVYAIGVGAEWFNGRLDNTDIPRIIEALAKYE